MLVFLPLQRFQETLIYETGLGEIVEGKYGAS